MENLTKEELLIIVRNFAPIFLNYKEICNHYNLTEDEMREYGRGKKIVENIKNLETYMILAKAERQKNDNPPQP